MRVRSVDINEPKLRSASKTTQVYPLNKFPSSFAPRLAEELTIHLASRSMASDGAAVDLEGKDWERIFASAIGAEWKPSNIGLDDIRHSKTSTAWGAKTVKGKPFGLKKKGSVHKVRLISGRNSPIYSYDQPIDPSASNPNELGGMILKIWNTRVREVRTEFENLRTVVLIKSDDLLSVSVFETLTVMYPEDEYQWIRNKKGNLEGRDKNDTHRFTWQPHGSQFTIIEEVPEDALKIQMKKPKPISRAMILREAGFDSHSYAVVS